MNQKLIIEKNFNLALENHQKNNLQIAERIYKKILKINPNHFQSICFLGTLSIQTKNFERAKKIILPEYKTDGSSGMDLMANIEQTVKILPGEKKIISTGIMVAIPEQYEIQIRPRSGLAAKNGISVLNTPGTIDSDYRGEIKVILINLGKDIFQINKNDRIAQMIVCPIIKVELKEVESLPETIRGEGGFGSTNK